MSRTINVNIDYTFLVHDTMTVFDIKQQLLKLHMIGHSTIRGDLYCMDDRIIDDDIEMIRLVPITILETEQSWKKTPSKKNSNKMKPKKYIQATVDKSIGRYDYELVKYSDDNQPTVVTVSGWGNIDIVINNAMVHTTLTRYVKINKNENVRILHLYQLQERMDLIICQSDIIPYNWEVFNLHHIPGYTANIVTKIRAIYKGNLILTTGWDSSIVSYGEVSADGMVSYMSTLDGIREYNRRTILGENITLFVVVSNRNV